MFYQEKNEKLNRIFKKITDQMSLEDIVDMSQHVIMKNINIL